MTQTSLLVGLATETTLASRFGGGKLAFSNELVASQNIVPTTGKRIRLLWVAFVPNPDNTAANLVKIGFVGAPSFLYTGYALAHWEKFEGGVDVPLRITLATNQPVAVTVHYEEF
jgi:hypothetical protein